MRLLIFVAALSIMACAKQPDDAANPSLEVGTYPGSGRDGLCIGGDAPAQHAGFVVYGADNANCSASGRLEGTGSKWSLIPAGDTACKIPFRFEAGRFTVGQIPAACAYYCGPGASAAGRSFGPARKSGKLVDVAGDPLC